MVISMASRVIGEKRRDVCQDRFEDPGAILDIPAGVLSQDIPARLILEQRIYGRRQITGARKADGRPSGRHFRGDFGVLRHEWAEQDRSVEMRRFHRIVTAHRDQGTGNEDDIGNVKEQRHLTKRIGDIKIGARQDRFIGAAQGDAVLWKQLVATLQRASTPAVRRAIVVALGSFREPALLESSLDLLLDGTLRSQDYRTLMGGVGKQSREIVWEWFQLRYDELLDTLGPMSTPRLPAIASGFCTAERAAQAKAFFRASVRAPSGTERNLSLALESIARCARLRARIREPLREWLGAVEPEPATDARGDSQL